jgi:hypothetical protein
MMEKTVRKKEYILEDCEIHTSQAQACPVSVSGMDRFTLNNMLRTGSICGFCNI